MAEDVSLCAVGWIMKRCLQFILHVFVPTKTLFEHRGNSEVRIGTLCDYFHSVTAEKPLERVTMLGTRDPKLK